MSQRKKFFAILLGVMVSLFIFAVITTFMERVTPSPRAGEAASQESGGVKTLEYAMGDTDEAQDDVGAHYLPTGLLMEGSGETRRLATHNEISGDGVVKESNVRGNTMNSLEIILSKYTSLEEIELGNNNVNDRQTIEKLRNVSGSEVWKLQPDGRQREKEGNEEPLVSGYDWKTSDASTRLLTNSLHQSSPADDQLPETRGSSSQKTILFYGLFFNIPWQPFLKKRMLLKEENCPVSNCAFVFNMSHPEEADAVVFHENAFNMSNIPLVRRPHQRYIWFNLEAPDMENFTDCRMDRDKTFSDKNAFFNWTFTYHRQSDVLMHYGSLRPLKGERETVRHGFMDPTGDAYRDYMAGLDRGDWVQDDPDGVNVFKRPKLVAMMVSHCSTKSGREFYVKELQKHVPVDVYGLCGDLRCGEKHSDYYCYSDVLRPNYKFYLSFENDLCDDYITEKVWLPMHYGVVPVVYGGANFSHFLPPNSYIDATNLTPAQLAQLLIRVGSSPQEYGRYHLWRRYWWVEREAAMCELCQKLHEDHTSRSLYNLSAWWSGVNQCYTRYPLDQYPRPPEPDKRTFFQKFKDMFRMVGSLVRGMVNTNEQRHKHTL